MVDCYHPQIVQTHQQDELGSGCLQGGKAHLGCDQKGYPKIRSLSLLKVRDVL